MEEKEMNEVGPAPRAGSLCPECGNPVNASIEANISVLPDGTILCGQCTRRKQERMGRDPRAIDRHHKFKFGEDPNDPDADPSSPWLYVTVEPEQETGPPNDKATIRGGPESGTYCFNCLSAGRGRVITRLVAALDPYTLLEPAGYRQREGTEKTKEKDIVVICPKCSSVTHFREEEFKRLRVKNGY